MFKETPETLVSSVQIRIDFPPPPIPSARRVAVPTAVIRRRGSAASPQRLRSVSREASQATDMQHVTYQSPRLECVSRVQQLIFSSFPALEVVSHCTSGGLRRPKELLCTRWCNVDARVPQPVLQFSEMVPASRPLPCSVSRLIYAPELRASCRKNCHQ